MTNNELAPISRSERIQLLDVLRGIAVCGILIGNMQWLSGYGMMPHALAVQASLADQITHFLIHFFIEGKFYSIFSFLFGFGFAMQMMRAEERGDTNATVFKRRLFWLLVIGLLHAYLLWAGDILSIYALMGFVLLLFRNKSNESLLKWAFWLLAVPVFTYTLLFILFSIFASPEIAASIDKAQADHYVYSVQTVSQSNYWQILTDYNKDYVIGRYLGLIFGMRLPKILAMFLLGVFAFRIGVFQNLEDNRSLVRKVLIWGFILGVFGNLLFALFAGNESPAPPSVAGTVGVFGYAFGVPALALSIVALISMLWRKQTWQQRFQIFGPLGRMAMTNYLLQTVISVTIFYGYGFGLFGRFGAFYSTLIALAILAFEIVFSSIWLYYFAFGPMEWIWRQLTYKKRIPLVQN